MTPNPTTRGSMANRASTREETKMTAAVYDLAALLRRASALANQKDPDVEEVAGVALGLASCRQAIDEALEPLKTILRDLASKEREGPDDVVEFDGVTEGQENAGVVSVTFQAPRPALAKSTNLTTLRRLLGPELEVYFDVKMVVEPRRDFSEVCDTRRKEHPTEVTAAMRATDLVEPTARVGFRPLPSVAPSCGTNGK